MYDIIKKLIVMALCAAIISAFAACSDDKASTDAPSAPVGATAEDNVTEQPTEETKENTEVTEEAGTEEKTEDAKETAENTEEKTEEAEKEPEVVELPKEDKVLTEVVALKHDDVIKMMDGVMSYFPGTAGSSLKIYIAAFEVLNLSERYASGDEAMIKEAVEEHISYLGDFQIDNMKSTVGEIDKIAAEVFANGLEPIKGVLDDAGNPQLYDSYNKANYDKVMKIIKEALGV